MPRPELQRLPALRRPKGISAGRLTSLSKQHERGRIWRPLAAKLSKDSKKNDLKPWRRVMWCIGVLTAEYRKRMYDLLALYGGR